MDEVLKIKELRVSFKQRYGNLDAVRGVSLSVRKGEILALVGESGCGKSVTAKSVLKLNDVSGGGYDSRRALAWWKRYSCCF